MKSVKDVLGYFNKFEWSILGLMFIANLITGGFADLMGSVCSITGVLCVVLVAKGKVSNFYFGIVNVALYVIISYKARLYGDFMLNAFYYLPIQFIGIYMWKKALNGSSTVKAKMMNAKERIILTVCSFATIIAYSLVLKQLGGNVPLLDATSTVLSIIAQILMLKCFTEQWSLWIIVNIVSVCMWIAPLMQGDTFAVNMIIMWMAYLINSIYAYYNWKRMAKEEQNV